MSLIKQLWLLASAYLIQITKTKHLLKGWVERLESKLRPKYQGSARLRLRLCIYGGSLFSVTGFRLVPPPVGEPHAFPPSRPWELQPLQQCPHSWGNVNTAQEAARAHQLLLSGPFCERAFLESLSHKRQEGPEGTTAPQWRGVLLIARYFGLRTTCQSGFLSKI